MEITFELSPRKDLSFTDIGMKPVVEPADFEIMAEDSSRLICPQGGFKTKISSR